MNELLLRIDAEKGVDEVCLLQWITRNSSKARGCLEDPGSNPHYHFHLFTEKSVQTLRAGLKNKFPMVKGNGGYSLKQQSGSLDYLVKGHGGVPNVLFSHNWDIPEDEVFTIVSRNMMFNVVNVADAKLLKDNTSSDSRKKPTFQEVVLQAYQEEFYVDGKLHDKYRIYGPSHFGVIVSEWMIKRFRIMRKLWDLPVLKKYVNFLLNEAFADDYASWYTNRVCIKEDWHLNGPKYEWIPS